MFRTILTCALCVNVMSNAMQVDINTEVSVVRYIHLKELHIYTDCGRCSHPLFLADNRLLTEEREIFQGVSLLKIFNILLFLLQ